MNKLNSYRIIVLVMASIISGKAIAQEQSLSLEQAVSLALANNPALKASSLEISKADEQTVISRSLFLPSVTATAFVNHYFHRPVFFGFGGTASDEKIGYGRFGGNDYAGAAVTAVQPLFNPIARPTLRRSRLKEKESIILRDSKQIELVAQVKQTYLLLLVLNERIKLQEQSIQRNRRALQDSRLLLVQGKALRVDTLRAYTAMKNLEPELVKLTFAIETNHLRLHALLGIDSLQRIMLTDSLVIPSPTSIPAESEVYEIARLNNPAYQQMVLQEQMDGYQAKQASASRLPVVSLVGQYQLQTQTNNFDYSKALYPPTSYVGVQIGVPLFTGLSTNARIKQSRTTQEQSTLYLKDATEQLKTAVHSMVANCGESLARIQTTQTVKETARQSFDIIQYRYRKGVASRLELTDAELAFTQAQSNYLEAVYDYIAARIALSSLMGRSDQ